MEKKRMYSVGIIGLGTIGTAIAHGLHRARPHLEILGTRGLAGPVPPFVRRCENNRELAARVRTILICVKPRHIAGVLDEIGDIVGRDHTVISLCAGVNLDTLREGLPGSPMLARAMPNIPCEINEGMTALSFSPEWQDERRDAIVTLFEIVGRTAVIEERHLDAVTAVSGCGPAYASLMIEALTDAGERLGLPRQLASTLVAQTFVGSALWVLLSGSEPAHLRNRVATPGGCTADALACLEEGNLRSLLSSAVSIAARKARTIAASVAVSEASDEAPTLSAS